MPHRFRLALLIFAVLGMPLAPVRAAGAKNTASLAALVPPPVPTGGVVGDGTPSSCTESALEAALAGGGSVTFNCGGPQTIHLTTAKTIGANTTINGGDVITLTGDASTRLLVVNSSVTLRLQHIVLDGAGNHGSDGGAISSDGSLYLESSTIQNSFTDSNHSGGAIFSDGPVTITNSKLKNNTAGSAGALFANFGQAIVTISGSTFAGNQTTNGTTGYGGAIWVGEQAQVTITGGAIVTNSAQYGGGLYLSTGAAVTLTSTGAPLIVGGNAGTVNGGGIYNLAGNLALINSTFSGNSAPNGGAIYNDQASAVATLTNVTLDQNSVTQSGGGIDNSSGTLLLTISSLSGNSATNGYGGGLFNTGTVTLTHLTFSGNSAPGGNGGGLSSGGTATLTHVTFSGNSAASEGGGLYNTGTLTLTHSSLSGNSAAYGGGFVNNQGNATLTDSTLSGNSSTLFGGGIYNTFGIATLTVTDVTLDGNSAAAGGGIYNNKAILNLTNATLSGNRATCGPTVHLRHFSAR